MASVARSLTAENQFTSPLTPAGDGFLNVSISGTWVATVWLQRSFDGGATWLDAKSYTANAEETREDKERGVLYRLGAKTGGFTSGTVVCRLGNGA